MQKEITHLRRRLAEFKAYGYDILKERNFAFAKAGLQKNKDVLEVGTGRGYMALTLAQKGFSLTTIDQDGKVQQSARAIIRYYKASRKVKFKVMNAECLRFKDNSFAYILAVNFLHHAKNPVRCLREMMRVANEKIVIVDMNKRGARILEKVHAQEGHCHERSKIGFPEIREVFCKAGVYVKTYRSRCQTVIIAQKGERR
ncbi:MAG: class I SAM-dependent methyltransferase [Candidatus Omnitrophica bacterium]|nr:class I SAM-dependent methyltransferase [Candidatus Omnitrophota bacterium]